MRRALQPDHDLLGEDEPPRDLVLGAPALLGIFLSVSLVCAVCFGFGYSSGHGLHTAPPHIPQPLTGDLAQDTAGQSAIPPDNDAYAKPTPDTPPPANTAPDAALPPRESQPDVPSSPVIPAPVPSMPRSETAPTVTTRPTPYHAAPAPESAAVAPPISAGPVQATPAPVTATPAPQPVSDVMVQIAAVSRAADAESLAQALRHDGFAATVRTSLTDGFFHVQIGPFADMNAAKAMRSRLAGDGYNAFIKH